MALRALVGAASAGLVLGGEVRVSPGFLVSSQAELAISEALEQPVFATRYHVDFSEASRSVNPLGKVTTSSGSFHYDWENGRELWYHGKGQTDNWCQCAGVVTDEPCHLISARNQSEPGGGAMHAAFPSLGKCCKVGDYAQGFGPLRPDWLRRSNATYLGKKQVGNRTCSTWAGGPPGDWFMMVSDDWSVDEQGRPCTYADHFKWWAKVFLGMEHDINFDAASYSQEVEDDASFVVPVGMGCEEACPNKEGWCSSR